MKKYFFILIFVALLFIADKVFAANKGGAVDISDDGVKFIAEHEGFRGDIYNDAAGNATIGYGHLIHKGPADGTEPQKYQDGLTEEQARALLKEDLGPRIDTVNRLVTVDLNQAQFDALVSFVYNVGEGAFQKSKVLALVNSGDFSQVPDALLEYNHAGGEVLAGLTTRREEEGQAFA